MLSILSNWIFMGLLCGASGFALLRGYHLVMNKLNEEEAAFDYGISHIIMAGIVATTLYAQVFSVFFRVNAEAFLVLTAACLLFLVWQRKAVTAYLTERLDEWKAVRQNSGKAAKCLMSGTWCIFLLALIAYACASCGQTKLIDTEWYHAQTIRWFEEYGCVKGVANIFYSLGFNNAQHYFDALFGMDWLYGQSMRGSGGFFGILIFAHGLFRLSGWMKHEKHMADALAVGEITYSIIVTAFFTDPYVDTLPNVLVLFVLTEWFILLEKGSENVRDYGLYSLFALFAVVAKTSVAMIVLLAFYSAFLMVKQKKAKQIWMFLGMGFLMAVPYLITNFITTGYPVYLLASLGFPVKWQVNPEVLRYSVDNMVAFARMPGATMEEALNCGLRWIPVWFRNESISHKILYLGIVFLVAMDLGLIIKRLVKHEGVEMQYLFPRLCVYAGLVYWFCTIPQVKYCWAFLIAPVALVPAYYWEQGKVAAKESSDKETVSKESGKKASGDRHPLWQKGMLALSILLCLMYCGFYSLRTLGYMKDVLKYPVMQADYKQFTMGIAEKNGQQFYVREEGKDLTCGYYLFPYLENKDDLDQLVFGENLGKGFYIEK